METNRVVPATIKNLSHAHSWETGGTMSSRKFFCMDNGWIKLHRKLLDNPLMARPAYRALWIEILLRATHNGTSVMFEGKRVRLEPGQFTTGTLALSKATGVPRGTVVRILETFKNEHQIEQRTDHQCSMITVLKWKEYQSGEQPNGQRVDNEWTTNGQRVDTKQECKNDKNEIMKEGITALVAPTPAEQAKDFFERPEARPPFLAVMTSKGISQSVALTEMEKFVGYWTEPNATGKKQRWQMQKTFEVKRRITTWAENIIKRTGFSATSQAGEWTCKAGTKHSKFQGCACSTVAPLEVASYSDLPEISDEERARNHAALSDLRQKFSVGKKM